MGHYRVLTRVPCAIQLVLIISFLYNSLYVNHSLPIYPLSQVCLLGTPPMVSEHELGQTQRNRDREAWRAAIHGVVKSQTRLRG